MFTPILGQELERREHHRQPWWVLLGLVAALAGEEATAGKVVTAVGLTVGVAESWRPTERQAALRAACPVPLAQRASRMNPPVSNLYWRTLEEAQAIRVSQTAARRRHWRFDMDLRAYLRSFLRAPTVDCH